MHARLGVETNPDALPVTDLNRSAEIRSSDGGIITSAVTRQVFCCLELPREIRQAQLRFMSFRMVKKTDQTKLEKAEFKSLRFICLYLPTQVC
jgi:hypothetical protein